ncbi:MAG: LacI family DNA-binding transcriptional regulator [Prolixibacteraceae bacterium]|nr:LacI family DNA-binding transcriptional regulator [Prolixibacteraceae bacterium]
MKEVTIYDIASELKVSPATVSRGLKNHPSISEKMKKKIRQKAEDMGYRTNTFASNLRTKRTQTLGVIVPRLDSNFMSTVLAGIEKIASECGYNLIITQSFESAIKEKNNALTLYNSRVDGLIVSLASDTTGMNHFAPFIEKKIPLLFFDRVSDCMDCVNIVIDNLQMGYEITNHLIEQGCKKIMHVRGNQNRNVYAERFAGYKKALEANKIPFDPDLVIETDLSIESGFDVAKKISAMKEKPDGIFLANDACASGCIKQLKIEGIKIPEEIAVSGFNNDPISQLIEPNLTTINYQGYEMGEMVAKLMINHLNGNSPLSLTNKIVLRAELIVRGSTLRKNL